MVGGVQVVVVVQVQFLNGDKVTDVGVELVQEITLCHEGFVDVLLLDCDMGCSISIKGGWVWPCHGATLAW